MFSACTHTPSNYHSIIFVGSLQIPNHIRKPHTANKGRAKVNFDKTPMVLNSNLGEDGFKTLSQINYSFIAVLAVQYFCTGSFNSFLIIQTMKINLHTYILCVLQL